jgi:hypothetical protein
LYNKSFNPLPLTLVSNSFYALEDDDLENTIKVDDADQPSETSQPKKVAWSLDIGIAALSEDIFSHMTTQKKKAAIVNLNN